MFVTSSVQRSSGSNDMKPFFLAVIVFLSTLLVMGALVYVGLRCHHYMTNTGSNHLDASAVDPGLPIELNDLGGGEQQRQQGPGSQGSGQESGHHSTSIISEDPFNHGNTTTNSVNGVYETDDDGDGDHITERRVLARCILCRRWGPRRIEPGENQNSLCICTHCANEGALDDL